MCTEMTFGIVPYETTLGPLGLVIAHDMFLNPMEHSHKLLIKCTAFLGN